MGNGEAPGWVVDGFQIGVRCVMNRFLDGFLDVCWMGLG